MYINESVSKYILPVVCSAPIVDGSGIDYSNSLRDRWGITVTGLVCSNTSVHGRSQGHHTHSEVCRWEHPDDIMRIRLCIAECH